MFIWWRVGGSGVSGPPGEGLGAVWADVGLLHTALVRAHVVAHAVLPLEALLADGAGVRLLVRVRQPVPVQVVHVPESFATGLAGVVLPHLVGGRAGGRRGVLLGGGDKYFVIVLWLICLASQGQTRDLLLQIPEYSA